MKNGYVLTLALDTDKLLMEPSMLYFVNPIIAP